MCHEATEISTYETMPSAGICYSSKSDVSKYSLVKLSIVDTCTSEHRKCSCTKTIRTQKSVIYKVTYVEGNCCSNLDFIEEAISCSVVKFAIASCAAVIANSCIAALMKDVFTTDLALIVRLY